MYHSVYCDTVEPFSIIIIIIIGITIIIITIIIIILVEEMPQYHFTKYNGPTDINLVVYLNNIYIYIYIYIYKRYFGLNTAVTSSYASMLTCSQSQY